MDANRSVLTLLKLLWMSFASFALACEKDDPDCGIHEKQNPPSIRTCKWQILKQDLTVFIPSIQTIDVEASCPMDPFGDMHIDECNKCAAMHQPCNDEFTACKGCCGTPWHSDGVPLLVPDSHSCDALKAYYLHRNSLNLTCGNDTDPNIGPLTMHVENRSGAIYRSGILKSTCASVTKEQQCATTPTKLEFQCDACNAGVPDLLTKCCDKCMEFANGTDVMNLRKQGIEAYVWCSGCDTTEVRSATGRPYKFDPSPYASRTEAAADLNMTMWVEDNVCSQFEHECAGPTPTTSTTTTTDYLHNYELLYSGLTNNTDQKNSWSCWRTTCGVTSGTNLGKRNPYNDLKLGSVTFSCHDSSFNLQWYATYELASAYRDRTLKDIVYSCVGSSPSNAADAQWNAGKCSPVGSRTDYNCTGGCAATPSRELRIGLGDGSEAADWILFAFQDGTSTDFASSSFMGVGGEDSAGTKGCEDGYVLISGEPHDATTTLATTPTTTTSTQCLDLCTYLNQFKDGRRLSEVDNHRRLQEYNSSEVENQRRLQDYNVADSAGSCLGFNVSAFWQTLALQSMDDVMQDIDDTNVTLVTPSVIEDNVTLVPVSSVVIAGLGEGWARSTLRTACLVGFATSLNAKHVDLVVDLEFDEAGASYTATAKATPEKAGLYNSAYPVEFRVQESIWRHKPSNSKLDNLKVVKRKVITVGEDEADQGKDAVEDDDAKGEEVMELEAAPSPVPSPAEEVRAPSPAPSPPSPPSTSPSVTEDELGHSADGSIVCHFNNWLKAGLLGAAVVSLV